MGLLDQIGAFAGKAPPFINGAVPPPMFPVGLGLMAGGTGLNNPGDEIQKALANYQQRQLGQQQMRGNDLNMQMLMARLKAYQDADAPSGPGASAAQPAGLLGTPPPSGGLLGSVGTPA